MNRKSFVFLLLALAVLFTQSIDQAIAAEPNNPVSGGILTISLSSSPSNLDPIKYTGTYESQIIRQVCDTVVEYKMDLSGIVPSLATEWKISDNAKEYTFKIRKNAYFHPGKYQKGRQVTAHDIKYSLERSAKQSAMNRLAMLDHCEVINDFEIKCVLTAPNSVFLTALTDAGNSIVPKEEVEGWGNAFGSHLVGSGPFSMKSFKLDQEAVLVRNEKYWAQTPYLSGVTFKPITDPNQVGNALKTGAIDYGHGLQGETVQLVRNDRNLTIYEVPGLHIAYIYFNQAKGPTADKRVRDAIAMAIDRKDLVKGIYTYNEAQLASIPLPPGSWGYDHSLEGKILPYNPKAAKELLAKAGYPKGFKTSIHIANTEARIKMATIVQQYLKMNLNIDLTINASEWGTFSEIASSGKADIYAMSWTWYPDPFFFLNKLFYSGEIGALGNGAGFKNAKVDSLLDKALVTINQKDRATLYKEALAVIVAENPIFVYSNENNTCATNKKVHGLIVRADNSIKICNSEVNVWKSK